MKTTHAKAAGLPVALPAQATPVLPTIVPADGLRKYLQEISHFPILSPEEERALAEHYRDTQDVAAAHKLVTSHLRLVAKIAFRYRGYGLPVAELIAEGNIGLMQAVKRFEPERGFRLATYAMWWIKAAIQEYVLRSWSLVKIGSSATQKRLFFNLRKLKRKIDVAHDREMTPEQVRDIAQRLEVSDADVIDMDQRMTASDVYLNTPVSGDGEEEKISLLAEPGDNQEVVLANRQEANARHNLLNFALAKLEPRERDILEKRRLQDDPLTLEELSQVYSISRERVRQIEARAFEKLQKAMLAEAA